MARPAVFINPDLNTPEDIARAQALLGAIAPNYGKAANVGEGIAQLMIGVGTGVKNRKIAKAETAGRAQGNSAFEKIMGAMSGANTQFPAAPSMGGEQAVSAPSATGVDVAKRLQADFNLTPEAAAGFAGNLAHESGNFKTLQEINPTVKGSRGGFGWAQWTGPRRRQFEAYAAANKLDPTSPEANYGFLKNELQGPEGRVLKALQGVRDPNKATQIVSDTFLRPGIPHMQSRISKTQAIVNALRGGGDPGIQANPQGMAIPDAGIQAIPQGAGNPDPGIEVASLDPSVGMPQQMYVGQVNPNGSIGTVAQKPGIQAIAAAMGNPSPNGMAAPQPAPAPQQMAQNTLRPFNQNERRPNPDGSYSTEVSTTWQLPDGSWTNVPSLWMTDKGPKQFDPNDEKGILGAVQQYENSTGQKFPRFGSVNEAEAAAKSRSAGGGAGMGALAQNIPPMPQNEASSLDRIIGMNTPLGAPQPQGLDVGMLMQAAQNPWLTDTQKTMVNTLLQQEMQKQDPAYQMQQQAAQVGLQKLQLELDNLQNPKPKYENIGGNLVQVNPDGTFKEVYNPPEPVTTEITDVDGKRVLINKATGIPIRELGNSPSKQKDAPAGYQMNSDGQSMSRIPGYRDTNLEMDMRKEFDAQSKDFRAVRDSYNRIQASAENPTPAGDLSLIFNYMKMLDPGSVVREAEFATAANAAPLLTRFGLDAEKLKGVWEGQRLTPEQRADFLTRSDQLYQEQDQTFQSLADQYTETAKRNGLAPENIILTPRANPRKKKTAPAATPNAPKRLKYNTATGELE